MGEVPAERSEKGGEGFQLEMRLQRGATLVPFEMCRSLEALTVSPLRGEPPLPSASRTGEGSVLP